MGAINAPTPLWPPPGEGIHAPTPLAGRTLEAARLVKSIEKRIESDNASLGSVIMRQRHRRWTASLLASVLDTNGPLYPRLMVDDRS